MLVLIQRMYPMILIKVNKIKIVDIKQRSYKIDVSQS